MASTKISSDAGSKQWLKERAAISAAHRRQKTDPAVARLIEKADQLHKERTQRHLHESVDDSNDEEGDVISEPAVIVEAEDEGEDIDSIVNVPPPEEIVVKVAPKNSTDEKEIIPPKHDKEATEEVYRSFAESVLEQGLISESSLELSFDLKPEDIKEVVVPDYEEEEDEDDGKDDEDDGEDDGERREEEKEEEKEEKKHDYENVDQLDNVKENVDEDSKSESAEPENLDDDDDEFEHIEKEETNKESSMEEGVVVDIVTTSENND